MENREVMLTGERLRLVPYLPHHVHQYHAWMTDPELLEATCSELLSLEEEYENQVSWLGSHEKLTFIILAPTAAPTTTTVADDSNNNTDSYDMSSKTRCGQFTMIGDCNAFCLTNEDVPSMEVEVSIAEKHTYRRKGYAMEAVLLLMAYIRETIGITRFVAKILVSNKASIAMFSEKLGFEVLRELPKFEEVHLVKEYSGDKNAEQEEEKEEGAKLLPTAIYPHYKRHKYDAQLDVVGISPKEDMEGES